MIIMNDDNSGSHWKEAKAHNQAVAQNLPWGNPKFC